VSESLSGIGVLDKAVVILGVLEDGPTSLSDLAARTEMPRATAHRLAVGLEAHGLVRRDDEGRFLLGPRLVVLGQAAALRASRPLTEAAVPALERLRDATGESAQLYVRSGSNRVCILSLQSPHSLRTIVEVGASLPMDKGSAAKALAGGGRWAESVEEREKGVASVSAPVRLGGEIVAAVSVSGPIERTTRQPGRKYAAAVVAAASDIEGQLR
jgi:DNA-binding IclR family transcriptional regulator